MRQNLRTPEMSFWNALVPELVRLAAPIVEPPIHEHPAGHQGMKSLASQNLDATSFDELSIGLYKILNLGMAVVIIVLLFVTCFLSCKYNKSKHHHAVSTTLFVKAIPSNGVRV